jgi:sulfatase maturation enzyme AslB (radical SAM superfamily)
VQLVTSAVREIPQQWRGIPRLSIVVSIDGLQPEHDARRTPATYDRILKHIAGHSLTVHCTVTRQQVNRPGYIEEFLRFWSARAEIDRIWFSLYTPQLGEVSDERLTPSDRERVIADLLALRLRYPKLTVPQSAIEAYAEPPRTPDDCVFARTTTTISADLTTKITPCQFGGKPDCENCGCLASAAFTAVGRYQIFGFIPVSSIFTGSMKVGDRLRRMRPEPTPA